MNKSGLTSFHIKMIAVLTMLTDHIGATVLLEMFRAASGNERETLRYIYWMVRGVGRIAFPLFIFMLIEGFFHTRNRAKYLLRLLIFCPVAEIPFDIALNLSPASLTAGRLVEWTSQNVMFTLAIGFLCFWLICRCWPGYQMMNGQAAPGTDGNIRTPEDISAMEYAKWFAACAVITAAGCFAAFRFHTDYSWAGVLAIVLCGVARLLVPAADEVRKISFAVAMVPLILENSFEAVALVDYFAVDMYNGEKGRYSLKWFFYLFYPMHFLILGIIKYYMIR